MVIAKVAIGISALVSAGVITSLDVTARSVPSTPAVTIQQGSLVSNASAKSDRLVPGDVRCDQQVWPYISAKCLTYREGTQARQPARVVAVERR
jgi:hypothetical protein